MLFSRKMKVVPGDNQTIICNKRIDRIDGIVSNLSNCPSAERLYDGMQTLQTGGAAERGGSRAGGQDQAAFIVCPPKVQV